MTFNKQIIIIGNSSIGGQHFKNLINLKVSPIIFPYSEFENTKLDYFKKYKNLIGIIIATSTNIRLKVIKKLYKLNLPLYIEKPLVTNFNDLKKINELLIKNNIPIMVGYMTRYNELIVNIEDKVKSLG